jgi:hypothetical protein
MMAGHAPAVGMQVSFMEIITGGTTMVRVICTDMHAHLSTAKTENRSFLPELNRQIVESK